MGGKRKGGGKMIRPDDPMGDPQSKAADSLGGQGFQQQPAPAQRPRAPQAATPQDDPFAGIEPQSKNQRKKQHQPRNQGQSNQGMADFYNNPASNTQQSVTSQGDPFRAMNQGGRPRLQNDGSRPAKNFHEESKGQGQLDGWFGQQPRAVNQSQQPAFDIEAELAAGGPKKKQNRNPKGQQQQQQRAYQQRDQYSEKSYQDYPRAHNQNERGQQENYNQMYRQKTANQDYNQQRFGQDVHEDNYQYSKRQTDYNIKQSRSHQPEVDQYDQIQEAPSKHGGDRRKNQREKKNSQKNTPKFENPADAIFDEIIDLCGSKIDQKLKETVIKTYQSEGKGMNSLHDYVCRKLVFPELDNATLVNDCLAELTQPQKNDQSNNLSHLVKLQSDQFELTSQVLNLTEKAVMTDSIENCVVNSYEAPPINQVDKMNEWLERIDSANVKKDEEIQESQEKETEIEDAEIDELLAMVNDPFAFESTSDIEEEQDNKDISEGLKMLQDINKADEVSEIVNQISRKQQEIKIRVEEQQIKAVENTVKAKMEEEKQREEKIAASEKIKEAEMQDDDSDQDDQITVIINKEIAPRDISSVMDDSEVQATPQKFNHAQAALNEQNLILKRLMDDDQPDDKDVVAAVIDDMPMDDFDSLLPPQNRAIVYNFELDIFQKRAVYRLEQGECVFVAAHTSAGKTVVAEYAIALSLKHMTKTIFTSPIKALSNQKFRDFKAKFEDVGILTGDVSINRDATCVIMTTEVLQNQLYSDSDYLQDVEWVIFDEVHYIDDAERGSVWEEVIMKLPDHISIVMLSATVGNYMQFAEWVGRTKKKTIYVQCTYQRPVPLEHYMIYNQKLSMVKAGEQQLDREVVKKIIIKNHNDAKQQKFGGGRKPDKGEVKKHREDALKKQISNAMGDGEKLNSQKQRKHENFFKNLNHIKREDLLPCVVFVFSRAQVESIAADVDDHLNFISQDERNSIREFKKKALQKLDDGDRDLPQVVRLSNLIDRGIGFHHAGMIPLLKEIVEILFTDNLLKVVFATSTFAIGLNMPARSVIFTQQKKHNGKSMEILTATEYLQMAGRAGRRGKDDSGASILCVDNSFGGVPHSEEYNEMFDNKGKDLESKLKMTYKTSLNLLNQEGQEFESLITNSFFSDETEKKKIQAVGQKKVLTTRLERVSRIECDQCKLEDIEDYYNQFISLQNQNKIISKECGLVPVVLKINLILTPTNQLQHAIIIAKVPQKIKKNVAAAKKPKDEWLAVILQKEDDYVAPVSYSEDRDYETSKMLAEEDLAIAKEAKGNQWWKKKGGQQLKVEGFEQGYHYEYARISLEDVIEVYKNDLQIDTKFVITNDLLTNNVLNRIITCYDNNIKEKGLDPIRPSKGKSKQLQAQREASLDELRANPSFKCIKACYHLTQMIMLKEIQGMLMECESLIGLDSNEKEMEFIAKNKVLQDYKMIDEEQNMLFKGKVARVVKSVDPILLTQLIFSGWLKKITDQEMLALLSVLVDQVKASKEHSMLETRISDNFWNACMFLEEECNKLIDIERKNGVLDQIQDPYKRLNYYFYEIVYDWANKKSFLQIKNEHPGLEEGIIIKCIMSVQSLCKTVKEMNNLIGDEVLAQRMDDASKLLDREIMSTQSLYFQ